MRSRTSIAVFTMAAAVSSPAEAQVERFLALAGTGAAVLALDPARPAAVDRDEILEEYNQFYFSFDWDQAVINDDRTQGLVTAPCHPECPHEEWLFAVKPLRSLRRTGGAAADQWDRTVLRRTT